MKFTTQHTTPLPLFSLHNFTLSNTSANLPLPYSTPFLLLLFNNITLLLLLKSLQPLPPKKKRWMFLHRRRCGQWLILYRSRWRSAGAGAPRSHFQVHEGRALKGEAARTVTQRDGSRWFDDRNRGRQIEKWWRLLSLGDAVTSSHCRRSCASLVLCSLTSISVLFSFCLFLLLLFLVLLVVDQWGWFRCVEDWSHGDELNGSGVVYFLFLLLQGLMNNEWRV